MYYNLYIHPELPKFLRWDPQKSEHLKRTRGVSFEEIIRCRYLGIAQHPVRDHQKILIFEHNNYLWAVPFVADRKSLFLKTIYPSRKLMRTFKKGNPNEKE